MVIKAQTPAGFAEEYIIESIWNSRFPPGTYLPAERELSELIGVTRTTLREVLQRLSRDGWLTIRHGKPTRVNNFWETSGLNLLETLAHLDHESVPQMIDNLFAVRTSMASIFISRAFTQNPQQAQQVLSEALNAAADSAEYTDIDYKLFQGLAFASGNPIYGLIINGLKGLFTRAGRQYFSLDEARQQAYSFYHKLYELSLAGVNKSEVAETIRDYGRRSAEIWHALQSSLQKSTAESP
ncbi:fatty acid metabolism transcriptional regulator FadR [Tatumella terrea]|uniref:fatty acid metabolism transcriptional regulator FadR n=1 Tax=Tatumella terrea TaxID=419007 RepID=UPI0031D14E4D